MGFEPTTLRDLVGCSTTELLETLWWARVKCGSWLEPQLQLELVASQVCFNVTARCSYESYVCLSWFDYVTAWCGSSQDPHFTLAHHRVSSSSVVEHPTRSRRVVGSNPIWNSEFLFPSFSVNAKFIMLYFYRKTHLAAGWLHLRYALMWLRGAVMSAMCACPDLTMWLRDAVLVKTHISPLLTIESPVAQW